MFLTASTGLSPTERDVSARVPEEFPYVLLVTDSGNPSPTAFIVRQHELAQFIVDHPSATLDVSGDRIELANRQLAARSALSDASEPDFWSARLTSLGTHLGKHRLRLDLREDDDHVLVASYVCEGQRASSHSLGSAFGPALALAWLPWALGVAVIANAVIWTLAACIVRARRRRTTVRRGSA